MLRPARARLDEMVWIALFAGYGGTSNLAYETLRMIEQDGSACLGPRALGP